VFINQSRHPFCLVLIKNRQVVLEQFIELENMVQKYKSPVRVYKFPFELVMAAYVRRFPTCDLIPLLVGTDVLKEETSEDGSIQVIERRCKLNVDAPYLLKKMAGVDYFYCIQRNTLDRRARTLKIEAWNETFAKRIIINEFCTYFVHEENEDWTCFEQSASLEVKSLFGFENSVEKLAVKHYAASIEKGKEIIQLYIEQLSEEGVTHVDRFHDKTLSEDEESKPSQVVAAVLPDSRKGSEAGATCASPVASLPPLTRTSSLSESRRESLEDRGHSEPLSPNFLVNHSSSQNSGHSVKNQVMSKAKTKICFIYNVINENIQREAV